MATLKLHAIKISNAGDGAISPATTIHEVIKVYRISSVPMKYINGGHAKFLHLLSDRKENKKVCNAFLDKWRYEIGGQMWRRYKKQNNMMGDFDTERNEFVKKISIGDLLFQLALDPNLLGSLTLPEGETIYLPASNLLQAKSGLLENKGLSEQLASGGLSPGLYFGMEVYPAPSEKGYVELFSAADSAPKAYFSGLIDYWTTPKLRISEDIGGLVLLHQLSNTFEDLYLPVVWQWDESSKMNVPRNGPISLEEAKGNYVFLNPLKRGLLDTYDHSTGDANYKEALHVRDDIVAEIHIYKGKHSLTGDTLSWEEMFERMQEGSRPGINSILVVLNESGTEIQMAAIDGLLCIENGMHIIKTKR
jgi:hypothetical protein